MLTGVIQPKPRTRTLDRSEISYALWEKNPKPNNAELPWPTAASFDASQIRAMLSSARTVVIGASRSSLYEQVLGALLPRMRVYAYGPTQLEFERPLMQALAKASDRVVVRLGYELPADWVVVDGGRAGVLFVGPPGEERRWAVPLEPALARSLFEAFRVLFWFHARREWLPDNTGSFAFRPPLASPYSDPGKNIPLRAGHLVIDGPLTDDVPDAELRIIPDGSRSAVEAAGRTATLVCQPDARTFEAPRQLVSGGTRVIWTEMGLPRTTISRQRLVMDFLAGPVGIQLEWGSGTAVDVFHHVTKACEAPIWTFHAQRRLREIVGPVLLEGAMASASVLTDERIDLRDLRSSLANFETAEPTGLPTHSPLARTVLYEWRTVPETVPTGAGKAQIIRQWTALDEWAAGSVRILRQRLETMEGEEKGILDRLRGFLRGQDALRRERLRMRDALTEIAEQPPSQRSDASETVRRILEEDGRIRRLLQQAQASRQNAEDEAEESAQRKAWEGRVNQAALAVAQRRAELTNLEDREAETEAALHAGEAAIINRTGELRAARSAALVQARDLDMAALDKARTKLSSLDAAQEGPAPKEVRRPVTQEIQRLEGTIATSKRELAALDGWEPSPTELAAEFAARKRAREAKETIRKSRATIQASLSQLEREAAEGFAFRPGTRIPIASPVEIGVAPPVPSEAPPEIGELFEYQGQRYLAVRTWEQVPRAKPVAARLRADLVAFPDSTK